VEGKERLAHSEVALQFADRTLPGTEENENLQSSFISERLQQRQRSSGVKYDILRRDAVINDRRWQRRDRCHIEALSHGRSRVVTWFDHALQLGITIQIRQSVQVVPNGRSAQARDSMSPAAALQPPDPGVDVARIDRVQRALRTEELHRETEPLFGSR
jgi:hypothetical protein